MTAFSQKFFHWSLVAFLSVSTFFYWRLPQGFNGDPGMYGYILQELFFRYGVIWLWGCGLFLNALRKPSMKDLGVFLLYVMVVSAIIAFDVRQRSQILNVFLGLVFYKTIIEYFDFKFLRTIAMTFFWILFANLVFCFLQYFNIDPIHKEISGTIVGFPQKVGLVRLSEHLGTLCAITAPLTAIISPVLLVVVLPLIYYSHTSAAVVSLIVALSFLIYRRLGFKWLLGFLLLTVSVGAFYILKYDMPGGSFGYRFTVWLMGLRQVMGTSLFMGLGIGSWYQWGPQTRQLTNDIPLTWLWAHNEYLQVLFELGVAGFVMVMVYIKNRFKDFEKAAGNFELDCLFATFISLCLISILHFPFHLGRFAALSVFVMASLHAKTIEESQ